MALKVVLIANGRGKPLGSWIERLSTLEADRLYGYTELSDITGLSESSLRNKLSRMLYGQYVKSGRTVETRYTGHDLLYLYGQYSKGVRYIKPDD